MIDLQLHSTASDGSFSPADLVFQAKEIGLTAIALTDHDTVSGVPEFMDAGRRAGIHVVPGVEISVDTPLPNHGHMHILGLFIDPQSAGLIDKLEYLQTERNRRADKILEKLHGLGLSVTREELLAEAGEGSIGRPHIARIMVRRNFVGTIADAFEKYLKKGGPAYVDKVKLGEEDAIALIKDAGGLAILAHPHLMNFDTFEGTREKILALREMGLDGFEVHYSGMPQEYSEKLLALASEYDLAVSGGSDFHGENKEGIHMGTGTGNLDIPDSVYFQLLNRWQNTRNTGGRKK